MSAWCPTTNRTRGASSRGSIHPAKGDQPQVMIARQLERSGAFITAWPTLRRGRNELSNSEETQDSQQLRHPIDVFGEVAPVRTPPTSYSRAQVIQPLGRTTVPSPRIPQYELTGLPRHGAQASLLGKQLHFHLVEEAADPVWRWAEAIFKFTG